jgi:hypothetical protein
MNTIAANRQRNGLAEDSPGISLDLVHRDELFAGDDFISPMKEQAHPNRI